MAKLINKMLNFVGWESEEETEMEEESNLAVNEEKFLPAQFLQAPSKKQQNKVVNIHSTSQLKVIITQPENLEDARDICDHLKNKKTVVVNLEDITKEMAQRIVDFLSGSIYALDGDIQKVSAGIFVIAPNNVDLMGEFKDELKSKGAAFPWVK
ncbi:MAG: cell division protein SepF [Clostridiales bacterium]|nr:cell division protein SepF [Clostridiales bacterium]